MQSHASSESKDIALIESKIQLLEDCLQKISNQEVKLSTIFYP